MNTLKEKHIDVYTIIRVTLLYINVSIEELFSKSRVKDIVTARHIAMTISRQLTRYSLANLGEFFDRDHASVLTGTKKVGNLCDIDKNFKDLFNSVKVDSIKLIQNPKSNDLETLEIEKPKIDYIKDIKFPELNFKCKYCGNKNVKINLWINADSKSVDKDLSEKKDNNVYCSNCKEFYNISELESDIVVERKENKRIRKKERKTSTINGFSKELPVFGPYTLEQSIIYLEKELNL
jgi:ribosomal protein L44E